MTSLMRHGMPLTLELRWTTGDETDPLELRWTAVDETDPPRLTYLALIVTDEPGEEDEEITPEYVRAVAELLPHLVKDSALYFDEDLSSSGLYLQLHPPRPDGTDAFYIALARRYRAATNILLSEKPNELIARANNVPVPTVARWVAEARRRGLLEPAPMRGKAGTK